MTTTSTQVRQAAQQLCAQSRFEEARVLLVGLLRSHPEEAEAWALLAKLYYQRRDHARALAAAGNATQLDPGHAEALYLMGRVHRDQGAFGEAEACYRRAVTAAPNNPDILTSLGVVLRALGRTDDAIAMYRRALACSPTHREAQHNLGNALAALGATAEAHKLHDQGRADLGARLRQIRMTAGELLTQGKLEDGRGLVLDALQLAPADAQLWLTAGRIDCALGRPQAGLDEVERAVHLDPDSVEANEIARRICSAAGLYDRAMYYSARLLALAPTEELAVASRLQLPCIQQSRLTIRETRDRYARGLRESLASTVPLELPPTNVGAGPFLVAAHTAFFLAYHGEDNCRLQTDLARLYLKRMPHLAVTADHCRGKTRRPGRLRVGFISRFLRAHSIGTTTRGLIDRLSRDLFEVYAIRITPSAEDATTQAIRAAADATIDLDLELAVARTQIAALELDVLFFQDIGMEPTSYFLAFARLAPVQCVSFGHPDTTGIPTMDYFVSNDLFEPENAQAHYSERLFLLRDLPTLAYYYRPRVPDVPAPGEKFGFGPSARLYVCPQALFKLHPDFDALIHGILVRDPEGVVVLIDGLFKEPSEQLRARFARTLPGTADRVRFIARLAYREFLELLSLADVILDTVHFNGMNTSLEAFAAGTPVVTLPGEFQRGRHTQAMYRKMGIADCIASDADHYIEIAVRLARDPAWANPIRGQLRERNHRLFEDRRVVEEFERFFLEAVAAGRQGTQPDRS